MELKGSKELKKFAAGRLADCWCECVCMFFMFSGILSAVASAVVLLVHFLCVSGLIDYDFPEIFSHGGVDFIISAVILVSTVYVLMIPFMYGVSWFLLQEIKGNSVPANCFFGCYTSLKRFCRTMKLHLLVTLRKLVILIPICAVGTGEIILAGFVLRNESGTVFITLITACLVLLLTCLLFFYIMFTKKYTLVTYLYAINPERSAGEIIKESVRIMYGKEIYLMKILLSFTGWFISCLLVFPAIYVVPYAKMTYAAAVNELIEDYNADKQGMNSIINISRLKHSGREDNILV